MKSYQSDKEKDPEFLREEAANYGGVEEQRLREALKRTDTEKFYFLMSLMKMNNTMKKAIIHHKK